MVHYALILGLALVGFQPHAGAQKSEPPASDRASAAALCRSLIPHLDQVQAQLDSRTVTYSCVVYGPRPGEPAAFEIPEDAESPDRVGLVKVATVYRSGSTYRVTEQNVLAPRDADEADHIAVFTSDGSQFHTRFANARGGDSTLMLDLNDSMHRVSAEMDAYGWRVMGQVAPLDYQQYMNWAADSSDLHFVSRMDGSSTVQWRFLPDLPQTRMTATVDEGARTLSAITTEVYDRDATLPGARLMFRKSVRFMPFRVGGETVMGALVADQVGDAGEE